MPSRTTRRLALAGASLLVALGVAEVAAGRAPPRTQGVHPSPDLRLEVEGGVPVWYPTGDATLRHAECAAPAAMVFGTSVLAGISLPADAVFSEALQDLGCVQNHAVAGYAGETMLARARRELPGRTPKVVLWEVSGSALEAFTPVGAAAYNLRGAPPPAPWLGALVSRSALAEQLWFRLAFAPTQPGPERLARYTDETLTGLLALAEAEGARVGVLFSPPLDRPFATFAADRGEHFERIQAWLDARGVATLDLATALAGEDVEALRLDPCCHFDADGHARIATIVRGWIAPWLAAP